MALIQYLTQIEFDFGAIAQLSAHCQRVGMQRPLIVTDAGVRAAGVLQPVVDALQGLPHAVFDATPSNPTEAAAIGVPDARWGEAVKAVVVQKPGAIIGPEEIIAFARSRIAAFKAPKSVDVIAALPRNASGKILRRELRAPYWAGKTRQVN